MLEICSHYILVDDRSLSVDALVSRKWDRSHLGKPSYKERNVSLHHYRVYFEGYVKPAFEKYGRPLELPPDTIVVDATKSPMETARVIVEALELKVATPGV